MVDMTAWRNFEKSIVDDIKQNFNFEICSQFKFNWTIEDEKGSLSNRPDILVKIGNLYLVIDAKFWKKFTIPAINSKLNPRKDFREWSITAIIHTFWYSYFIEFL